jgi:hypothetical protein
MEHELTGLEEHLRDEAWECGELAARRREAEREARLEAAHLDFELEEARQAWGHRCESLTPVCQGRVTAECFDLPF